MVLVNHATKEIAAKLVYYGPGLCGKTTNLRWIQEDPSIENRGKLVSLATQTDRTLFFDLLPAELGTIGGMRTRIQIYTVPGQVVDQVTWRMVLKGCDAVVFVADSQAVMLDANVASLQSLRRDLLANDIDAAIPMVIQYNKRDISTALPISVLNARLNPRRLPFFEAVAVRGVGVEDTLRGVTRALFAWLSEHYGDREAREKNAADGFGTPAFLEPAPEPAVADPSAAPRTPAPPAPASEPAVFRGSPPEATADPPPRGEGLREEQWLYLHDRAQKGPVDIEDLVDLILTAIPQDTKVWHPGFEGWVRADEAPGIAEEIPPPLPGPGVVRSGHVEEEMPDFATVPSQFRTVLIADEDEGFRKYLAMPLAAQGFTIHEAADGSAAWQMAVQNRPWLILADVSMPEVDGFEFCQRVRSHPLLSHTPLLFISGSDRYKKRYRALQIGADDFLSKQTPIRELLMRIQLLLTKYSDLGADQQEEDAKEKEQGAFQGRIEFFGAPALLQMCAQGQLSGLFTALAEDEDNTVATMGFRDGQIVSATNGTRVGIDAVYAFLAWDKGSFTFSPGDAGNGEPLAQSVEHLVLEGCRLLDEARKDDTEAPS